MKLRLQKYLAKCGIASRRKAEELILQGKVKVNDKVINELGYRIDDEVDQVFYNNKLIKYEVNKKYIMLNKPVGYVSTVHDQFNRSTVIDLINGVDERVYPIGRLDYHTSGLLLLTNDGDLTYKITHPKHNIDKTYIAILNKMPPMDKLMQLEKGIKIGDYTTAPAKVRILDRGKTKIEIIIHEGKNRQVRRMVDAIGYNVIKLHRISIGQVTLGNLKAGQYRNLTDDEINYLKEL